MASAKTSRTQVFGKCIRDFPGGQPPILRDLLCALKHFLGCPSLFIVVESPEKVLLMRKAWDMGKDPLTIMRSSPHALASALKLWLACLPEPLLTRELAQVLLQAQACLCGLERLRVLQQIFLHADRASVQVLHALLELLHHHRLNARCGSESGDALAAVFAPLLLPAPLAQDCPEPSAALVDTLIGHYRAVFSGAMPAALSVMPLELPSAVAVPNQAAVHAAQKGALGGRHAVDALFGLNSLPEAEEEGEIEEEHAAWPHCCCPSDSEDGADEDGRTGMHIDSAVPRSPSRQIRQQDGVVPEVEQLLWGSMDSVLFETDDGHFLRRCETSFASLCTACGSPSEEEDRCMACDQDDDDEEGDAGSRDGGISQDRRSLQSCSPTSVLPEQPSPFLLQHEGGSGKGGHHPATWPAKLLRVCGGDSRWHAQQRPPAATPK